MFFMTTTYANPSVFQNLFLKSGANMKTKVGRARVPEKLKKRI
jgi:hypothetical protein